MRFPLYLISLVLLALVIITSQAASSSNGNSKTQKQGGEANGKCSRDCGDKYEPICAKAKSGGNKERLITFGNDCVMANYNCQHSDDQFETKSKGECGGNVSVRLS